MHSSLFTRVFWIAAAVRAVKTLAQTLVGVLTASFSGLLDVNWLTALSVAGFAALVSLLTSVATVDQIVAPEPSPAPEPAPEPVARPLALAAKPDPFVDFPDDGVAGGSLGKAGV